MRHNIRFLLIVTMLLLVTGIGTAQKFVHPGIDMNSADLEYMRNQVLAGKQPWKDAYDLLKEKTPLDFQVKPFAHVISGPYSKPDIGGKDLSQSARMAYSCAVLWYISREECYAEIVIDIIEKWANTLRSFDENNAKLLVALTGYEFCNAAEILRYNYPGWKKIDTENMTRLMMSAFYPTIRYYFPVANGNWDGAIMHTLLAIAVFTDNRELFDNAVYHYLHANANGSLIKYIYPTGQCQETRRDQGHVQMGLYEFSGAARIAYTQGVDLFSAADNRLALGLEYSARFICGDSVYAYGVPSQRERFKYRAGFEHCIDHFTAKGVNMPYLKELCSRTNMNNPANALWKLTAFREEFRQKPSELVDIQESKIAYHAGATLEQAQPVGHSVIEVNNREDLQAVLNTNAGSGKTLFLRAGEYRLKQSLTIPSDIHICGEGRSTVLICEPTIRTAAILLGDLDAKNITIENLVVDGSKEHQDAYDPNSGRFYRTGRYSNALAGISMRAAKGEALPAHVESITAPGIAQVKLIDATPIGINVRSTVATYANVHDELRKIYARSPLAREKGCKAGDFSYNTGRLRCPGCDGTGTISLDIQFLPDVEITCPDCGGSRYQKDAAALYRTRKDGTQAESLPRLMEMSVDEALAACADLKLVASRLQTLSSLGLGYLTLGEATPSLSGGEAQRLKLASEMGKGQADTVFVFDEPTIGLHPLDVRTLLGVFQRLIDSGATVVVIEHDLDVIRNADYLVDLGPGGGESGGRIVACGTPEQVAADPASITGKYLHL